MWQVVLFHFSFVWLPQSREQWRGRTFILPSWFLGRNVVWRLFLLPEVARLSSCLVTLARKCLSPTWFHVEATVGHNFPKEDQCLIKDMGVAVFPLCRSQNLRLISPIWVHFGIRARSPLISVPQSLCLQSLCPLVNLRFSRSLSVSRCTVGAATASEAL